MNNNKADSQANIDDLNDLVDEGEENDYYPGMGDSGTGELAD